jgi:siroheme synthase
MTSGKLIGVGVGPGDPELLTLKATRALGAADVIVHFAKAGNGSNARAIVANHLKPGVQEMPLAFPITTEVPKDGAAYRDAISAFYDASATAIATHLDKGKIVAVISEGDPLHFIRPKSLPASPRCPDVGRRSVHRSHRATMCSRSCQERSPRPSSSAACAMPTPLWS